MFWAYYGRTEYNGSFFFFFTALMCSDSIFNLLKRVAEGGFLFLCKRLVFSLSAFLEFGFQIRCDLNWYTDLKSALDHCLTLQVLFC